jgi:hypothetical protein
MFEVLVVVLLVVMNITLYEIAKAVKDRREGLGL